MAKQILRPTSVKVCHLEYQLEWLTQSEWKAPGKLGQTDNYPLVIRIVLENDDDAHTPIAEGNIKEVFLHELLHACAWVTMWADDKKKTEEGAVLAFASPLLAVLRDNPDVIKYLTSS